VTGQLICSYEGEDHPGQGTPVTLLPVTAYTKEMIDRELGDGVTLVPSDPRLKKYLRIVNTDDQGHFAFRGVPAGEYFVAPRNVSNSRPWPRASGRAAVRPLPAASPQHRLCAHWANFHCNEAHIIAKVSARRESLHFFDDLLTQLKSG
jgi:hypothetical protein